MEEEKGKIFSWSERETVFQSWRKKRRQDDETVIQSCSSKKRRDDPHASPKINGKEIRNRRDDDDDRSSIFISNDVLEEIMLRLPVKALIRFQTLSKHWRRRIESRSFKERHLLHQKTTQELPRHACLTHYGESNLTLTTRSWSECSWSPSLVEEGPAHHIERQREVYFDVSHSCDGIVCIFDEVNLTTPVTVMNPAMKRSQILPLSMFQRQYLDKTKPLPKVLIYPGFGKDHVTGTYKLVWLHNHLSDYTLSCEVFDFEAKKWSYVLNTPCDLIASGQPIFAEGWLYWLTANQFDDHKVLAYNLHTEMFRVITNRIVSEAPILEAVRIFSLNDRIWLTDFRGDGKGIQHFWRIKNELESHWESEKMFSIDSRLISPWFVSDDESSTSWPFFTLVATSKDNKKVNVSKSFSSQLVQLIHRSTSLCFSSAFSGPPDTESVPYFQSLYFPL